MIINNLLKIFKKHLVSLSLGAVFLFGIYIYYKYFTHRSLWIDEGYSIINALQISQHFFPYYHEASFWDGSYLLLHYFQGFFIYFFGFSETIVRIPSLIFTFLNIFLVFIISQKIFSKKIAIITTILLSINYDFWIYGLQARYYSLLAFFLLLWIYIFILFQENKSVINLILLFAVAIIGYTFHIFLLPLVILSFAMIFQMKESYTSQKVIIGCLFIIIFGIVEYMRQKFLSVSWSSNFIFQINSFQTLLGYHKYFISQLGAIYLGLFFTPIIGYIVLNKKDLYISMTILSIILVSLIGVGLLVPFYAQRYVFFLIPLMIILSVGIRGKLGENLPSGWEKNTFTFLLLIITLVTLSKIIPFREADNLYMRDIYSPEPEYRLSYMDIKKSVGNKGFFIISAFPHMDKIYLGQSNGYLYIDETGQGIQKENSMYTKGNSHVFTNSPIVETVEDLQLLESKEDNIYIMIDTLSEKRIQNSLLKEYIIKNYTLEGERIRGIYTVKVYHREETKSL